MKKQDRAHISRANNSNLHAEDPPFKLVTADLCRHLPIYLCGLNDVLYLHVLIPVVGKMVLSGPKGNDREATNRGKIQVSLEIVQSPGLGLFPQTASIESVRWVTRGWSVVCKKGTCSHRTTPQARYS